MTRTLSVTEVLQLYRQVMDKSGGTVGILSMEALENQRSRSHELPLMAKNFTRQQLKRLQHLVFHWL